METTNPHFIPGDFVVFSMGQERKGMGQVLGATMDGTRYVWRYYILNPNNAQTPYLIDETTMTSVYRKDAWEAAKPQTPPSLTDV